LLGPIGSWAAPLRNALLRLLWCAVFPARGLAGMPQGWFHGRCGEIAIIPLPVDYVDANALADLVAALWEGSIEPFVAWLQSRMSENCRPFETLVRNADLELLTEALRRNQNDTAT